MAVTPRKMSNSISAPKHIKELQTAVAALQNMDLDSGTGTFSSNALTATKRALQVTTESLSTAHTASQALAITLSGVSSTDLAFVTRSGGTNTTGVPNITSVVCTTNTVTINLKNEALATNAFNGTFKFNVLVYTA